ncbi:MAG: bifunctional 3-demethylubiquinol 3-O-methyltransferase/2-polyprenyl-6-hydroxyphenol methylase [Alphaproteobacteria bacterium 13_2_20CM_2_64_7]|nr:MAG: bifunctional 3-demethylubiquinol 3-O-methyltransferase/2-polyprenyl-6-hydroxyphenol methylase [Alphaproteobacteria bacterium 13_2_20CM_2_64_7]
MASRPKPEPGSTVDAAEVAQFSAYAAEWWDPRGKMAMLHRFNPVRLAFIKQVAGRHFLHADEAGVVVDYRATRAEALADEGERFDVVLAMEVVEHVADLGLFISRCAEMVRPGGLMITATLNRTLKSFALAIVGAEYVLRWLPRGTHQWEKFVTPNELEAALERHGLRVIDETGVIYNLLADRWQLSTDMDVNYMVVAERAPS